MDKEYFERLKKRLDQESKNLLETLMELEEIRIMRKDLTQLEFGYISGIQGRLACAQYGIKEAKTQVGQLLKHHGKEDID